jgi:hypothetical protein
MPDKITSIITDAENGLKDLMTAPPKRFQG